MKKSAQPTISVRVIDFDNSKFSYHEMNEIPKRVPVMMHMPTSYKVSPNSEDACALAELSVNRAGLYAKLTIFNDKKKLFEDLMIRNSILTPYGFGMTTTEGIKEYNLICLYLNEHN
jgi:hypothetical protein